MVNQLKLGYLVLSCLFLAACGGGGGGGGSSNSAPTFAPTSSQTVDAGSLLNFTVTASDPDGPAPLSMAIQGSSPALPSGFSFADNGSGVGTFTWTPAAADAGSYMVTFAATEAGANGKTTTRNVSITVEDPSAGNNPPTFGALGNQATETGELLSFAVNADDPDGPAPLTLTLSGSSPALPAGAVFTDNGSGAGAFNWTPETADVGDYDVTFAATDGAGLQSSQTIMISVSAANQAPELTPIADQVVASGEALQFAVSATDADGPAPLTLTLSASSPALPAGAVFTDNGSGAGEFNWTPDVADVGDYDATFTATDGAGLETSQTISITVSAGNQAPELSPIGDQLVTSGELLEFTVSATDPDGPAPLLMTLDNSAPALPVAATYTDNGDGTGSFSWQTELADAGSYDVTFRATESGSAASFDEQTITITVNDPPTLNTVDDQSVLVGELLEFAVSASDPDGPAPLNLALSSVPALPPAAVFTDNGDGPGDFAWTPDVADNGSYLVTFTATDNGGTGASVEQSMTIWVRANDTFSDDFEDGNANGWVIVNDTNVFSDWTVGGAAGRRQYRQLETQGVKETDGGLDSIRHLGTYAYRPDLSLTDFRLEAAMQLRSEFGEECGLMWRYQDGDNYYRLSFNLRNGFGLLERKLAGVWTTLARNSRGLAVTQEHIVEVTTQGPVIQVAVDGELLFAAHDSGIDEGSIGVYARAQCGFDIVDVTPVDAAAKVAIAQPTDFSVDPGNDIAVAATVLNRPTLAGLDFELNSVACDPAVESTPGLFESTCSAALPGAYSLTADLTDNMAVIDSDDHTTVGVGGDHYAAIGDSIHDGSPFDNFSTDGTTTPGWVVSSQGANANLTDRLNAGEPGRPHIVADYAVPSDRSADTVSRLSGIFEQSPESNRVLLLIGTNDARDNVPFGIFQSNIQAVIDGATAAGKDIWISRVLPIMGPPGVATPYVDPATCDGASPCPNDRVQGYNDRINLLIAGTAANEGPDLWDYYLGAGENRVTMYGDSLHPNGLGTAVLGALWNNALTGETELPYVLEGMEVRLSEGAVPESPILYKQNLIEVGDAFYVDSDVVLTTAIPVELQDGVWIMTADAEVNQANTDYLSFDVGSDPVDVYLAYDAAVALPASLSGEYLATGLSLTTDNTNAPVMTVYVRSGATGTVVIDGANGTVTGAGANYVVIVAE